MSLKDNERFIHVTESDIQTLIKIAVNYKATLDLIVENSKLIPFSDTTGIGEHYALYEKVRHICE